MSAVTPVDLDPVGEQLLVEGRERLARAPVGREFGVRLLFGAGLLAVAVPLALLGPAGRGYSLLVLFVCVAAYAVASRIEFEVGSGGTVPTELVLVPMLFLIPAALVPLAVAAALVLGQLPAYLSGRTPVSRAWVAVGNAWYALGPALVMLAYGEPAPRPAAFGVLALALLAQFACDFVTSVSREWLAVGVSPRHLLRPLAWVVMVDVLLAPVAFAAALGSELTRAAVLLPLPLLGLIWVFARERRQRLDQMLELSTAYRGTAFLLGDVVEADDAYTGAHSREVVELVLGVCDELRIDPRSRRKAELAALLHDVGKIRIPGEIINKPGPLTPEERVIINTHTIEGERLLARVGGLLAEVGAIVRSCHEDYDGGGYPDGLAGETIPLVARIVSACDAYNAMTTDRSYRKGRSSEAALAELEAHRGSQFDPDVVDAIARTLRRAAPASGAADTPA